MITETLIAADWWNGTDGDLDGPQHADLAVERDENDPGKVAIHTMLNGTGSHSSYYLDREAAIRFASEILDAVVLR
jgi:hypothetical protein